jgi:hypothetical protein
LIVLIFIINRTNLLASYSNSITALVKSGVSNVYYSDQAEGPSGSGSQSGSDSGSSDEYIDDRDTFVPVFDQANKDSQCANGVITKEDGQMDKYTYVGYDCTLGLKRYTNIKLTGTKCAESNGGCGTWYVDGLGKIKFDYMKCKTVVKSSSTASCNLTPEDQTPLPNGDPAFCVTLSGQAPNADIPVNPCKVIKHTFTVVPTKGAVSFFGKNHYDNVNLIRQMTKEEQQALCNRNPKCRRDTGPGGYISGDPEFGLNNAAIEYERGLTGVFSENTVTVPGCKSTETWICKWNYQYGE